jgi:hypothetical protein
MVKEKGKTKNREGVNLDYWAEKSAHQKDQKEGETEKKVILLLSR